MSQVERTRIFVLPGAAKPNRPPEFTTDIETLTIVLVWSHWWYFGTKRADKVSIIRADLCSLWWAWASFICKRHFSIDDVLWGNLYHSRWGKRGIYIRQWEIFGTLVRRSKKERIHVKIIEDRCPLSFKDKTFTFTTVWPKWYVSRTMAPSELPPIFKEICFDGMEVTSSKEIIQYFPFSLVKPDLMLCNGHWLEWLVFGLF